MHIVCKFSVLSETESSHEVHTACESFPRMFEGERSYHSRIYRMKKEEEIYLPISLFLPINQGSSQKDFTTFPIPAFLASWK